MRIFELYHGGIGAKDIANILNEEGVKTNSGNPWSTQRVLGTLRNQKYTGTFVWNKGRDDEILIENSHPPIIDWEIFDSVQNRLSQRSPKVSHPRSVNSSYIVSGLIYCGECGAKLVGKSAKSGAYSYYACSNNVNKGKSVCDSKAVNKDLLERELIRAVRLMLSSEEHIKALHKETTRAIGQGKKDFKGSIKAMSGQLSTLQRKRTKLYERIESGKYRDEDLAPRLTDINDQIQEQESKLAEFNEWTDGRSDEPISVREVVGYVTVLRTLLKNASNSEKKLLLSSFIDKIVVNHPEIEISYKLPSPKRNRENSPEESSPYGMKWLPGSDSNQRQSG